jgi:hypothetical protein
MYQPIVILHIAGGAAGLVSGAAAMVARKGGAVHRKAGTVFFGAMLLMSSTGAAVAMTRPDRITATMGVFTFYLVLTSWMTARGDGRAGGFERFSLAAACAITAAYLLFGVQAALAPNGRIDGLPGMIAFVFGAVAALAAAFDLSFLIRGALSPRQRVGRHLWRMCFALLIAAMSFFLGQQKVMPAVVRGSPLLYLPPLAVLAGMAFWAVRTRFPARRKRRSGPAGAAHPAVPGGASG